MFASAEYQLAGLPVVSTESIGGRDILYDPETWIMVDADPRQVAEATAALKARGIPRQWVREKALNKLRPHRESFTTLLDRILCAEGHAPTFGGTWPFRKERTMCWMGAAEAVQALRRARVDAFEGKEPPRPRQGVRQSLAKALLRHAPGFRFR